MRNNYLLKIMSVALAFLLIVCTQGNLAIYSSAESGTSSLSAYYTANATQDNPLVSESFDKHWSLNADNMAVRKELDGDVWTSNTSEKLAVLYVNTKRYKNFQMTVDYKGYSGHQTTDNMVNVVGFGATDMTKSFYFDSNTFAVNINKYGGIMNKQNTNWLSDAASDKISGFSRSSAHTLTLKVYENKATYIIDGVEIYSITLSNYNEAGYIFLATNKMTTQFGVPDITELDKPPYSLFSSYYTPNAAENTLLKSEAFGNHWNLNTDNMAVRKELDGDVWSSNSSQKLSVLYVNTKKYDNFEMTVDYKGYSDHQTTDNMVNVVGFGATDMTKSFYFDSNSFAVNINKYGGIMNRENTNWLSGAASDKISGFDISGKHTLTLRVLDKKALYLIDGVEVYTQGIGNYNESGYIFLATNKMTTAFGIPKITELEASKPDSNLSNSPLYKKSALFIGDSNCFGSHDSIPNYGYAGRIGLKYGMEWNISATSGVAVFTQNSDNLPLYKSFLKDGEYDFVVLFGGMNDAIKAYSLGEMTTDISADGYDTTTFAGAFEEWISLARKKYRNSKLSYVIPYKFSDKDIAGISPYYEMAKMICNKWNVDYIDLYNNDFSTYTVADESGGTGASQYLSNTFDLNSLGYDLISGNINPEINPIVELMEKSHCPDLYDTDDDGAKISSVDMIYLKKVLLGAYSESYSCDINYDSSVNIIDLVRIKKYLTSVS